MGVLKMVVSVLILFLHIRTGIGVRVFCYECESPVLRFANEEWEREGAHENKMMIGDFFDQPIGIDISLKFCRNSTDTGKRVGCPHQFARCYFANISWTGEDGNTKFSYARGCGGAQSRRLLKVHEEDMHMELTYVGHRKYFNFESRHCSQLPHPYFPSINKYYDPNLKNNSYCFEAVERELAGRLGGEICLCNRVFCNGSEAMDNLLVVNLLIFLLLSFFLL